MLKRRLRDSTIILIITLCMLLLLETGIRLTGIQPAEPLLSEWMQAHPTLLWINKPNSHGTRGSRFAPNISYVHNNHGMRMREDISLQQDAFRVMMIGDSNIWGFGVEQSQTASAVLQDKLSRKAKTNKPVQVLNMGITGHSSYQGKIRLQDSELQSANVIVLAYGYNDRRYTANEDKQDSPEYFEATYDKLWFHQLLLQRSAICGWFASWNQEPQFTSLKDAMPRVSPKQYQSNFDAMLKKFEKSNVRVIVLGLRDNPAIVHRINQARLYEHEEKYDLAVQQYFAILQSPNISESTLAPYMFLRMIKNHPQEVGKALKIFPPLQDISVDKLQLNLESITLPLDSMMGGTVIRTQDEYLELLLEVCSNYKNVTYVDYAELLKPLSEEERLSCYFSTDPCHINVKGNRLLAEYLEPLIWNEYEALNGD